MGKFAGEGGLFYELMRIWGVFWPFKHFWKLKTTICKYWTLIKIKSGKMYRSNENFFWLITWNCYLVGGLTFGGDNKNFVCVCVCGGDGGGRGGSTGRDFSRWEEMIKFLKHIVQKHIHVNIPNLLNDWQATTGSIGKWFKKTFVVNKNMHIL